jgi:PAS domain-containing protein
MTSAGQSTGQDRQAQDVDAVPTLAWSARPDGSAEFFNRRWLDYAGLSAEEAIELGLDCGSSHRRPRQAHGFLAAPAGFWRGR